MNHPGLTCGVGILVTIAVAPDHYPVIRLDLYRQAIHQCGGPATGHTPADHLDNMLGISTPAF